MYVALDDWMTWAPEFRPWLEQRFSPEVLAAFTANAEPTWLTWLDRQQAAADGRHQNSIALFEEVMRGSYLGVRVIHASRLVCIDSVIQSGLRAWSATDLRRQANDSLGDISPPTRLRQVVEVCNPDHRGGYVYSFPSLHHALLEPDEERGGRLPDFCSHGGEFLASVRRGLGLEAISHEEETRAFFFACNLPWSLLAAEDVTWLAETMLLTVLTSSYLQGNFSMHGDRQCMTTTHDILPSNIALFADVEHLAGRDDLYPDDIPWQPLPT